MILILLLLSAVPLAAPSPATSATTPAQDHADPVLTADAAVRMGLARSPALSRARARTTALDGEVRATRLFREEPRVQARWAAVGDVHNVAVSQPVSVTGAGRADHRRALSARDAARADLARIRLELAVEIRTRWIDAVTARARVRLLHEALEVARRARRGAADRLARGDGTRLDADLAVLATVEVRARWMEAVRAEAHAIAQLASRVGRPVDAIRLPGDPLDGAPPPPAEASGAAERADVLAARHVADAAEQELARARADALPPLRLGAFYEEEGPELRIGPTVQLTLPVWHRSADARAAAHAGVEASRAALDATVDRASAERAAHLEALARLESEGTDDAVPARADAALRAIEAGARRGALDLRAATRLRQAVVEGQLAWLEGRRTLALARLDAALATDDPALIHRPGG
jgi:outer membrane protein, heavy metal efflux system